MSSHLLDHALLANFQTDVFRGSLKESIRRQASVGSIKGQKMTRYFPYLHVIIINCLKKERDFLRSGFMRCVWTGTAEVTVRKADIEDYTPSESCIIFGGVDPRTIRLWRVTSLVLTVTGRVLRTRPSFQALVNAATRSVLVIVSRPSQQGVCCACDPFPPSYLNASSCLGLKNAQSDGSPP